MGGRGRVSGRRGDGVGITEATTERTRLANEGRDEVGEREEEGRVPGSRSVCTHSQIIFVLRGLTQA